MIDYRAMALLAKRAVEAGSAIVAAAATGDRLARTKPDGSLVTEADIASQQAIVEILRAATPDCAIYAEEAHAIDRQRADYTWIIDPLDGTHNFHFGFPMFAVQVALESRGEIVAAAMALPAEHLVLHAWRQGGCYANGALTHVSTRPSRAGLMLIEPRWTSPDFAILECLRDQVRAVRVVSSSCISLAYIALGRADLLVDWDDKPWDLAAGTLLVEEAGGRVTDLRGDLFQVYRPQCLASNAVDHAGFVQRVISSGAFNHLEAVSY